MPPKKSPDSPSDVLVVAIVVRLLDSRLAAQNPVSDGLARAAPRPRAEPTHLARWPIQSLLSTPYRKHRATLINAINYCSCRFSVLDLAVIYLPPFSPTGTNGEPGIRSPNGG